MMGHIYILFAAFFTSLSQLILKYQMNLMPEIPQGLAIIPFVFKIIFSNIWIMGCAISTLFACLCWVGAVSRFQLSMAFPYFSGLTFVIVTFISVCIFKDVVSFYKIIGIILILVGIAVLGLDGNLRTFK